MNMKKVQLIYMLTENTNWLKIVNFKKIIIDIIHRSTFLVHFTIQNYKIQDMLCFLTKLKKNFHSKLDVYSSNSTLFK